MPNAMEKKVIDLIIAGVPAQKDIACVYVSGVMNVYRSGGVVVRGFGGRGDCRRGGGVVVWSCSLSAPPSAVSTLDRQVLAGVLVWPREGCWCVRLDPHAGVAAWPR